MSLTTKEEDGSIKPRELVFLLAIAGRIDAQSRLLAQKLNEDRYVYHAYAVLDSLSCSCSMFKYFFEVFSLPNTPVAVHDFMVSPAGIATVTIESLFLVSFAFLASYFDGEDSIKKASWKRFIVSAWPYFRDVMKGLKNAFKAWKSVVQIGGVLGVDLKFMLIPMGLVLGILAVMNRLYLRYVVEKRKVMMSTNSKLLRLIRHESSLTQGEYEKYLNEIAQQDISERIRAFFSMFLGGLIDGLYLYGGVISLAVLAPQAFVAMLVISAFYALSCVISRLYEEYDYQLRLLKTQTECYLALTAKKLETTYVAFLFLYEKINKNEEEQLEMVRLKKEVSCLIARFDELHQVLQKQVTHSFLTAGLLGMKNGLFAYGVLAGFLFMTSSLCSLGPAAFPSALIIACISVGLVLMLIVVVYSLYTHYQHLEQQKKKDDCSYEQLIHIKETIATQAENELFTAEEFKKSLNKNLNPKPSPQFLFQQWLEFFRSLFSGLSKGKNYASFLETPFQEVPHEHDTLAATILSIASSVLFSVVLALRALAREMGRAPPGQTQPISVNPQPTKVSGGAGDSDKKVSPDCPPRKRPTTHLLRHSLFTQCPEKSSTAKFASSFPTSASNENISGDLS